MSIAHCEVITSRRGEVREPLRVLGIAQPFEVAGLLSTGFVSQQGRPGSGFGYTAPIPSDSEPTYVSAPGAAKPCVLAQNLRRPR